MGTVCVDGHFRAPGGVLDITSVIPLTLISQTTHTPVSIGAFTTERPLPGTNHHDTTVSWTNTYTVPVLVVAEVMCLGSFIIAPQPNLTLIRALVTVGVGVTADTPDVSGDFDSEFGGGFDITDQDPQNNPEVGRLYRGTGAFVIQKTPEVLQPGQAINVKFRMASYTPQPWLANANNNSPGHQADVKNAYTRIWAAALGAEV